MDKLFVNENKYKVLIANLSQKIFYKDRNSVYVSCNESYAYDLKIKPDEIVGKTDYDFYNKELAEKYRADDKRIMESGKTEEIEEKYIQDGQEIIVHTVKTPIKDEKGSTIGILGIFWDITENKRIEEKLRRSHGELELRIQERTAKLEETNKALMTQITERELSEAALRESEERYRKLVEFSPNAIAIHSDGKIVFVNAAAVKLIGAVNPEQLIGKSVMDFVHPDYQEIVMERIRLMREEGKNVSPVEEKFIKLDGSVIDVEVTAMPFIYQGKPGIQIIIHDITDRKSAEEALKQSEEKYRNLIENIQDGVFLIQDTKIQFANEALARMIGYTAEEIIGKDFREFVAPEDLEMVMDRDCRRHAGEHVPREYEFKAIHRDGTKIIININIGHINYNGKVASIGTVKDITERKQAEEALKQSEEKYRTLIDNIQDGVFIIQDTEIQFANEVFAKVSGYTVEEVIGKDFRKFVAQEDLEMIIDRYHRRQAGEDVPREYELHIMHKDGRTRILVNANVGLITYRGRAASMVTAKDITEKKKLESQLLRSQRMESIGTLASGIAHDINNVLTPIMLSQELLQENLTDKESKKLLNTIKRNTHRGANLMKQVLSFTKGVEGERNTLQVAHLVFEIRQIVKETFQRNIQIRTEIPKDLWTISGDATQLHQVLMNLCVNARDAMPDGGILCISAENLFIDKDFARVNIEARVGPYILVSVTDTGTGIPPETLDRIFEPFFTTKEHGKGTGLGLSTALGIVKNHGGFINVYSEVGNGTVFKVYLPAITTTEIQKAEEHQRELITGHGELILAVDDEDQILNITKKTLEAHGYKVITANDGKKAISLYSKHREKIKLILMDMMMPIMDGPTSIRELHKINPELKIIAVSGLIEKDKLTKVVDTHECTFLTKPYTTEKLLNTIYDVISTK